MPILSPRRQETYVCRTCDAEFSVPSTETPVCCPICRMNRIRPRAES